MEEEQLAGVATNGTSRKKVFITLCYFIKFFIWWFQVGVLYTVNSGFKPSVVIQQTFLKAMAAGIKF